MQPSDADIACLSKSLVGYLPGCGLQFWASQFRLNDLTGSTMAVHTALEYAKLKDLWLDPENPRLGNDLIEKKLTQDELLGVMQDWTLEELAVSFLDSGFWPQEALIVVKEKRDGEIRRVVVEGNRRLAALRLLKKAVDGRPISEKWAEMVREKKPKLTLFEEIPYLLADARSDVLAYIGFRHVTGIKQWEPAEKAAFIAKLVDEEKLSYQTVTKRIGSKVETVRRNYISYRILLQMRDMEDRIHLDNVEKKFSVLFLSLRTQGVQTYLDVDILAEPAKANRPVPKAKLDALANFAKWLFGTEEDAPIVSDSRQVERFAKALENDEAVKYLERNKAPKLDIAYRMAGGEEFETLELVELATDRVREALATVHHYTKSRKLAEVVERFGIDALELLRKFPEVKERLWEADAEATSERKSKK